MRHSFLVMLLFSPLVLLPSLAAADAWSTFGTPLVEDPFGRRTDIGEEYDRYKYPVMAGNLFIWVDEFYRPNDGDT